MVAGIISFIFQFSGGKAGKEPQSYIKPG